MLLLAVSCCWLLHPPVTLLFPAAYHCPVQVCHARNQHGRLLADLYRLSAEYEPTPAVYSCLDPSGLLVKRVTSKVILIVNLSTAVQS